MPGDLGNPVVVGVVVQGGGSRGFSGGCDQQVGNLDAAVVKTAKRTVERIEAGSSAQMSSVIRILRTLELLPRLDHLFPETEPRPMDLLKRKGKPRRRAS